MMTKFTNDCRLIRQQSPIIHNITNYVAMNFSANALLAIGASPLMSSEPEEMEEIAGEADALVINIGCLERTQAEAMFKAASVVHALGKPWVLDPAGVGLSRLRRATADRLVKEYCPALIRGNATEIMVLSGADTKSRGLDSRHTTSEALEYASRLAVESGAVVAVSGATDYVTDGKRVEEVSGGSPMMACVTAMGCTASAVAAAFLAVDDDAFAASVNAMTLMATAGRKAAEKSGGPGSFAAQFIDCLYERA